jgi:hypothetical protein
MIPTARLKIAVKQRFVELLAKGDIGSYMANPLFVDTGDIGAYSKREPER